MMGVSKGTGTSDSWRKDFARKEIDSDVNWTISMLMVREGCQQPLRERCQRDASSVEKQISPILPQLEQRLFVCLGLLRTLNLKVYNGSSGQLSIYCGDALTSGNHLIRRIESACGETGDRNRWNVYRPAPSQVFLLRTATELLHAFIRQNVHPLTAATFGDWLSPRGHFVSQVSNNCNRTR